MQGSRGQWQEENTRLRRDILKLVKFWVSLKQTSKNLCRGRGWWREVSGEGRRSYGGGDWRLQGKVTSSKRRAFPTCIEEGREKEDGWMGGWKK